MEPEPSCKVRGVPSEPIFFGDYSFNTGVVKKFAPLDYAFLVTILCSCTAIGFYHAWSKEQTQTLEEYLSAHMNMPLFPVSVSLAASFISAVTLLMTPLWMYLYSTMNFWNGANYIIAISFCACVFIPVFYQLRTVSTFEYLGMRFSRGIRSFCALLYLFFSIAIMTSVLSAPSIAVHVVTGIDDYVSRLTIGLVCTMYTAAGGMRAVIWTDIVEMTLSVTAVLLLLVGSMAVVGGPDAVFDSAIRTGRAKFFDVRLDPTASNTVWSTVIGVTTMYLFFGFSPTQMIKIHACRSQRDAKIATLLSILVLCFLFYVSFLTGFYMSAFYENCDPLQAGIVKHPSEIPILFMMDILGGIPGLPGLYLAGIMSASLSSIASCLTAMSTVIVEDFVKVYFKATIKDRNVRRISQIVSFFFGVIAIETSRLMTHAKHIRTATLSILNLAVNPMLVVFILGFFVPHATWEGAWFGIVCSIVVEGWLFIGRHHHHPIRPERALTCVSNCNITAPTSAPISANSSSLAAAMRQADRSIYQLSWQWNSPITVCAGLVMGVLGSYVTGLQDPTKLDPRLIIPFLDEVFPFYYLPESIREYFRFGIKHEGKFDVRTTKNPFEDGMFDSPVPTSSGNLQSIEASTSRDMRSPHDNDADLQPTDGNILEKTRRTDRFIDAEIALRRSGSDV